MPTKIKSKAKDKEISSSTEETLGEIYKLLVDINIKIPKYDPASKSINYKDLTIDDIKGLLSKEDIEESEKELKKESSIKEGSNEYYMALFIKAMFTSAYKNIISRVYNINSYIEIAEETEINTEIFMELITLRKISQFIFSGLKKDMDLINNKLSWNKDIKDDFSSIVQKLLLVAELNNLLSNLDPEDTKEYLKQFGNILKGDKKQKFVDSIIKDIENIQAANKELDEAIKSIKKPNNDQNTSYL
jgi:hypothetical protein